MFRWPRYVVVAAGAAEQFGPRCLAGDFERGRDGRDTVCIGNHEQEGNTHGGGASYRPTPGEAEQRPCCDAIVPWRPVLRGPASPRTGRPAWRRWPALRNNSAPGALRATSSAAGTGAILSASGTTSRKGTRTKAARRTGRRLRRRSKLRRRAANGGRLPPPPRQDSSPKAVLKALRTSSDNFLGKDRAVGACRVRVSVTCSGTPAASRRPNWSRSSRSSGGVQEAIRRESAISRIGGLPSVTLFGGAPFDCSRELFTGRSISLTSGQICDETRLLFCRCGTP